MCVQGLIKIIGERVKTVMLKRRSLTFDPERGEGDQCSDRLVRTGLPVFVVERHWPEGKGAKFHRD